MRLSFKSLRTSVVLFALLLFISFSASKDKNDPVDNTISGIVSANVDFSTLKAAVTKADLGATLSATGPFTVFAPTNKSFRTAGFPTIASIQATDAATLTSMLTYHVIAARVFPSYLVNGAMPTTVNGGMATISLTRGATGKRNGNAVPSNIVATIILGTNDVVHVIDRVLLPWSVNPLIAMKNQFNN